MVSGCDTDETTVSPRLGPSRRVGAGRTSISCGIYYQSPETFWLNSHPSNKDLRSLRAEHAVLGVEHEFAKELRAGVEIYDMCYHTTIPSIPRTPF